MRGRLTLEKVNAAISDMASYAEANAHLIAAPKQKVYYKQYALLPACKFDLYACTHCCLLYYKAGGKPLGESIGKLI